MLRQIGDLKLMMRWKSSCLCICKNILTHKNVGPINGSLRPKLLEDLKKSYITWTKLKPHLGLYSDGSVNQLQMHSSSNVNKFGMRLRNRSCTLRGMQSTSINIFDRSSKKLQRERAANNEDGHLYDYVKEEVGYRLADRIFDIKKKFKKAVDLGCGRGYVTKHITQEYVDNLVTCDLASGWLNKVEVSSDIQVEKLEVDEETLPFDENSVDLFTSCLSLHWVNDLPGTFKQIQRCLKPDGAFLGAMFGGETLYELRGSLQLAEVQQKGGVSPHISPFTLVSDIGGLMNSAGFRLLTIDTDEICVGYPSMFDLMWDLKGMGESNAAWSRALHLPRETMLAAAAIYKELYGTEAGTVPATFQIIYMIGWKPDKSQPQPIERGTGQMSLKDLHRLDEIASKTDKINLDDKDSDPRKL